MLVAFKLVALVLVAFAPVALVLAAFVLVAFALWRSCCCPRYGSSIIYSTS